MNERIQVKKEIFNPATFQEYFPGAEIKEIKTSDLPEKVLEYFENKSRSLISPDDYKPGNFDHVFAVRFDGGDLAFFAQQLKEIDETLADKVTYFADFDKESGAVAGSSELRYNIKSSKRSERFFKKKPYVGWTDTEEGFKRKGLGKRRLFLMNAVSQMSYNLPAFSGGSTSDEARALWEKLVQENKAMRFKEGENDRYMMTAKKFDK